VPSTTTIHALDGPDGRSLAALFDGDGADVAVHAWAEVLYQQRDVLVRRGEEWRKRNARAGWRRLRYGDEGDAAEATP